HVDAVVPAAVEGGAELRERVELGLAAAPVVAAAPVLAQVARVVERDALGPAADRRGLGPAGAGEPVAQVGQVGLGHLDPERAHGRDRRAGRPVVRDAASWAGVVRFTVVRFTVVRFTVVRNRVFGAHDAREA